MIRQIKSEFQKLLTVRSTYFILLGCLAITILFAFYIQGYNLKFDVTSSTKLAGGVTSAVAALALFISLVGALMVTHEYRYNTIMYTLTSANSRFKVLIAKFIVISLFSIAATMLFAALSPILAYLGVHLRGLAMVPQSIPYLDLLWRSALYGWGFSMLGLIFAFIIRNQVGTLVALIALPGPLEALLGLLLKENAAYLPFTALSNVINNAPGMSMVPMSASKAAGIALAYIVVGWIIAALLFKKRDAN